MAYSSCSQFCHILSSVFKSTWTSIWISSYRSQLLEDIDQSWNVSSRRSVPAAAVGHGSCSCSSAVHTILWSDDGLKRWKMRDCRTAALEWKHDIIVKKIIQLKVAGDKNSPFSPHHSHNCAQSSCWRISLSFTGLSAGPSVFRG